MVDFDPDPALEGYDADALYDEFSAARKTVLGSVRSEWDAMGQQERDSYKRPGRSAYDVYLRNRIVAEMSRS